MIASTAWWQWPTAIAGVILALGVIWAKVLRPIVHAATVASDIIPPLRKVAAISPTILTIADEFTPNGGNSLADRIHRIDETQQGMDRRLTKHIADDKEIQAQMREDGLLALKVASALKDETAHIAESLKMQTEEAMHAVQERQAQIIDLFGRMKITIAEPGEGLAK